MKTTIVTIVCLWAISCSPGTDRTAITSGESSTAQANPNATSLAGKGFDLVNFTGAHLRGVYLSPADSSGWEENLLGTDILVDGDTVDIHFVGNEAPALWDLKVVAKSGYYAEWKGLDLQGISRITLAVTLLDKPTAVAELE